jgi:tyrosine-protein kinase Etk/Wzc
MTPSPDPHPVPPYAPDPGGEGEVSLGEMLGVLWDGRWLIVAAVALALALGSYYAWRKSPIYQVDALLQVEDKKAGKGGPAVAALEGMFEQTTKAQAEIEIIKSNLVLGRAVEALDLDILATPDHSRVFGDAFVRGRADAPELLVEKFEVPGFLRGVRFRLIAQEPGAFRWEGPKEEALGTGKVGQELRASYQGQALRLQVRRLTAKPGQAFNLSRQHQQIAIKTLRTDLRVAEKGKQTNILGISFEHRNPGRGAEILNEIIGQYVRQNIERKAEEASQTLAFLQEQMPQLRARLDTSENNLNSFRMKSGSVDLPEEAKLLLKQSVDMESQALLLKQKKQELLRTYQEGADVVTTLNQQIAKLEKESTSIESKVKVLPQTQQEVVRLLREVQVNTELYTALLNNVQQLQVAKAGEIGNARIVDRAMATLEPIKPQKGMVLGLSLLLGIFGGVGLTLIRRALHQGVEDPRLIESRLGLPVVVTIPHSDLQSEQFRALERHESGCHLLAKDHPEDLAVESLRSLRTSLAFTMMDARNRVVMISGPSPHIGKSFVSANFSALLAQTGAANRVLLVDGDIRRGNLHGYFGIPQRQGGLSEVLAGQKPWKEVVHATEIPGLDLITTGTLPPNPSELLMSVRFPAFIEEVSKAYDIVIIDAPPVLAVTDAVIIGGSVGTVLMMAKSKAHPLDEIRTAIKRFESGGIRPKGCIFNDVPVLNVGYRYYRYAYHYGYKK